MTRITLILLCLLAASVQGAQVVLEGGTSRYVVQTNDTITISGTKVTYTGRPLSFPGVTNAFIDGQGDTIVCNTSDSTGTNEDNPYGFFYFSGASNVTCSALTVIDNGGGNWNVTLEAWSTKRIRFVDCKFVIKGRNSTILHWPSGGSGCFRWYFESCEFESQVDSFTSRCQNDAGVTKPRCQGDCLDSIGTAGYYTVWYRYCTITRCPAAGFGGRGVTWIDTCNAFGQDHNDEYDYPSGNVCWSADNGYLFAVGEIYGGSRIVGCTARVYAADPREGCRGIMIEEARGTAANPVVVAHNHVEVTNGQSDYAGSAAGTWAYRFRQNSDNGSPLRHVHIHHNTAVVKADTISSTAHIGPSAVGIYFSDVAEYGGADSVGDSCYIYNNTVLAWADTVGNNYGNGGGVVAAMVLELKDSDQGHRIYGNNLRSNQTTVGLGGGNGGCSGASFSGDTIELFAPSFAPVGNAGEPSPIWTGVGAAPWNDNVFLDPIFVGADEDSADSYNHTTDNAEMFFDVTLTVTVNGSNSLPVSGASVWAVDAYGDTTDLGTTNASGIASAVVSYDYRNFNSAGDSTYNNYAVGAAKDGDTAAAAMTVDWSAKATTRTLSATLGTGGGESPAASKRKKGGYHKGGRW